MFQDDPANALEIANANDFGSLVCKISSQFVISWRTLPCRAQATQPVLVARNKKNMRGGAQACLQALYTSAAA